MLSPDGEWIDVPAASGELVLIFGDYLQLMSAGRVRSPVHRVLLPGAARSLASLLPPSLPLLLPRRLPLLESLLELELPWLRGGAKEGGDRYSFTFFFYPEVGAGSRRSEMRPRCRRGVGDMRAR